LKTVLSVLGTRPEAIKMAPVIRELANRPDEFTHVVCTTGQHREMVDDVLDVFGVKPQIDLDLMEVGQTPLAVAAKILSRMEAIFAEVRPDWVVVQGDTTTAMAVSLAAFYAGIAVGHVEAGLRTYDRREPFPEEINRRITDLVSDLYFAPTERSVKNLEAEGISGDHVLMTGNTVIDALLSVADRELDDHWSRYFADLGSRRLVLVTAHRRENFGRPHLEAFRALRAIALDYTDSVRMLYPVHPNPAVAGPAAEALGDLASVELVSPLDYVTMAQVMRRAHLIVTDSGGLQEEAPSLGVPVLVLRDVTERPEAVEAGTARLVGTDFDTVTAGIRRLLDDESAYREMAQARNPFGDGHASERIADALSSAGAAQPTS
jgi:UDP-N-acetylglucosamine 2-epimerase (non-hydrolysing)